MYERYHLFGNGGKKQKKKEQTKLSSSQWIRKPRSDLSPWQPSL